MRPFPIIGLFCEDIREEKSGQDTIIGTLPDNLNVPSLPGMLPKLGIYIRIQLERDSNPRTIRVKLRSPEKTEFQLANLDELIGRTKAEAEENRLPFAGLVARGVVAPFQIRAFGMFEAIVEVDGTEYVCAVLNIVKASTASVPAT